MVGDRIDAPTGIGDRDDEPARALVGVVMDRIEGFVRSRPGGFEEGIRLDRRARLGRDDRHRPERVEVVECRRHEGRIGRVEDAQPGVAVDAPERPVQDVGRQGAAAHARHDDVGEPLRDDGIPEPLEAGGVVREMDRGLEPAEPLGDRGLDPLVTRPERRVVVEEPVHPLLVAGPRHGRVEGGA